MKRAEFLLINDIHVSKDNIPEFRENWQEALDICQEREIADIIVGGDMFQSRAAQTLDVLLAVQQALVQAQLRSVNVIIADGNHDKVNQEECCGYNKVFDKYAEYIADYAIYSTTGNVDVYVMSYFPENGSFVDRFESMVEQCFDSSKTNVLYTHEGIRGGLKVSSDDELPASMFNMFDSVLVGHYHDRQHIPGTKIQYIGASRQHNFGEDELKGYTILYSDGTNEFVQNKVNVRYRVLEIDSPSDINDSFFKLVEKLQKKNYRVKVLIHCKSSELANVDKASLLDCGIAKVEFLTERTQIQLTESQSIEQKFDKAGIQDAYKKFCVERNVPDVEMGLLYLSKIK